jgi:hypothetical protein
MITGDASLPRAMSRGGIVALRYCVWVPAGVIVICVCVLFSGVLPPRSPRIADLGLIIGAMSFIEAVSLGVMIGSPLKEAHRTNARLRFDGDSRRPFSFARSCSSYDNDH